MMKGNKFAKESTLPLFRLLKEDFELLEPEVANFTEIVNENEKYGNTLSVVMDETYTLIGKATKVIEEFCLKTQSDEHTGRLQNETKKGPLFEGRSFFKLHKGKKNESQY